MHIVFLTSTNLTTNPRTLKEIRLALQEDIKVTVVLFKLGNWSDKEEELIKAELQDVTFHYLSATRSPFFKWILSTLVADFSKKVAGKLFFNSARWYSYAFEKRSFLLVRLLKKIDLKPDWVIAHNLATFYPALNCINDTSSKLGIDMEDYHVGEEVGHVRKELASHLIENILPKAQYVSYAAPLIKTYTLALFNDPKEAKNNHLVVNNVFGSMEFKKPLTSSLEAPLKLVWFSQNIDFKRGLENILGALDKTSFAVSLTLIGDVKRNFAEAELQNREYIKIIEPLGPTDLLKMLAEFDVGLAVEDSSISINRDICLTNKIWAYFQAGLYILATDTLAQHAFIDTFYSHGVTSTNAMESLLKSLENINRYKGQIRASAYERFTKAKETAWEFESKKLLKMWKNSSS